MSVQDHSRHSDRRLRNVLPYIGGIGTSIESRERKSRVFLVGVDLVNLALTMRPTPGFSLSEYQKNRAQTHIFIFDDSEDPVDTDFERSHSEGSDSEIQREGSLWLDVDVVNKRTKVVYTHKIHNMGARLVLSEELMSSTGLVVTESEYSLTMTVSEPTSDTGTIRFVELSPHKTFKNTYFPAIVDEGDDYIVLSDCVFIHRHEDKRMEVNFISPSYGKWINICPVINKGQLATGYYS